MKRHNPYSLDRLWPDETHAAYKSMPTNKQGVIVGLPHTPDALVPAAEQQWRDWCSRTPRHLWPTWINNWADVKRLRGLT